MASVPRGMPAQMSQPPSTIHIQPEEHGTHPDASLIPMLQRTASYQVGNAFDRWGQPFSCSLNPWQHSAFAEVTSTDVREHLAGAGHQQQLTLMQIDCQRLHVGTVRPELPLWGETFPG